MNLEEICRKEEKMDRLGKKRMENQKFVMFFYREKSAFGSGRSWRRISGRTKTFGQGIIDREKLLKELIKQMVFQNYSESSIFFILKQRKMDFFLKKNDFLAIFVFFGIFFKKEK